MSQKNEEEGHVRKKQERLEPQASTKHKAKRRVTESTTQESMSECGFCHSSVPVQSFCSQCGARLPLYSEKRRSVLERLKQSLDRLFWSEERSEGERLVLEGIESARFRGPAGERATLEAHERAASLNPNNPYFKHILTTTLSMISTEREMSLLMNGLDKEASNKIASCVKRLRQSAYTLRNIAAGSELDRALNGALGVLNRALHEYPSLRQGHQQRGSLLHGVADHMLFAHGIIASAHLAKSETLCIELQHQGRLQLVQSGDMNFGVSLEQDIPDLSFAQEIVWLYQQAEGDFREELAIDPTDTQSHA